MKESEAEQKSIEIQKKRDRDKALCNVVDEIQIHGFLSRNGQRIVEKYLVHWLVDVSKARDLINLQERLQVATAKIVEYAERIGELKTKLASRIEAHDRDGKHLMQIKIMTEEFKEWRKTCSIAETEVWEARMFSRRLPPEPPASIVHQICSLLCAEHKDMVQTHEELKNADEKLRKESTDNARYLAERFASQRAMNLALKFYANEDNYDCTKTSGPPNSLLIAKIAEDNGKIAREALNPKEE